MEGKIARLNTDIPVETLPRYGETWKMTPNNIFYGSDMNMMHKTWTGFRTGAILGTGVGLYLLFPPDNRSWPSVFQRISRHCIPIVLGGTTYGVGVGIAANVRQKDGPLNHVIGGVAAGSVIGSLYKSGRVGCNVGFLLALVGGVFKMLKDNDALPDMNIKRPFVFNMYRTGWFTERPDPEGNQDMCTDDSFKRYTP